VKIANDSTGVEIVIGHNRMNLLPFGRCGVSQRCDEDAGFALLGQSLHMEACC
jgi:hypothetical protein